MDNKQIGRGFYEIVHADVVTLKTGNRDKARAEVLRLKNLEGVSRSDIYILIDGITVIPHEFLV